MSKEISLVALLDFQPNKGVFASCAYKKLIVTNRGYVVKLNGKTMYRGIESIDAVGKYNDLKATTKPVYNVFLELKDGDIGCHPVKANTKKEARIRFKKRFPKRRVLDIEKTERTSEDYYVIAPL
jgi:hypothetical protein